MLCDDDGNKIDLRNYLPSQPDQYDNFHLACLFTNIISNELSTVQWQWFCRKWQNLQLILI